MTAYDLFVIGGGSGGVRAARIAARHGARVGLAEMDRIGGTCVIRGCVPKKLMVLSARFRDAFEDSVGFGWSVGDVSFDWPTLRDRVQAEVDRLNAAYIRNLEAAGVRIHPDRGTIEAPGRIRLHGSGEMVEATNIIVATGGHPNRLGVPGDELAITSDDMFTLEALPRRIAIVGAGYVAVEFASIMEGFGVEVTLIHRGSEILTGFDGAMRTRMREALERRGIRICLRDQVTRIARADGGLALSLTSGEAVEADQVLLAIGRSPNTAGIGLDHANVRLDEWGAVEVDAESRTSTQGIYAIGDVTGGGVNLTPVAIREGHVLADRLFGGGKALMDHANVPHAVFGTPELGCIGLTEEEAVASYPAVDIFEASFRPMALQFADRDEPMHLKLVVDAISDRVLGCHMIGASAAEMTQLAAIAIKLGASKADFDATVALHPTSAEELVTMREPVRRIRRSVSE